MELMSREPHRGKSRKPHARTRTCVGCGARVGADRRKGELIRLVFAPRDDGGYDACVDLGGGSFGRGAWVHARHHCLDAAVNKGLGRSAKGRVVTDVASLTQQISAQAERRAGSLLGAAQRAGKLAIGAVAVGEAFAAQVVSLLLVATDAAAAAKLPAVQQAQGLGLAMAWGDKVALGAAVHRGEVGVIAVCDDGIASALRQAIALSEMYGIDRN